MEKAMVKGDREKSKVGTGGQDHLSSLWGKRILLIVGGAIAAYKTIEILRRLRENGVEVQVVLTESARSFIPPLSVAALCGVPALDDLFDPGSAARIDHVRLSRASDLILIAPASADLLAKMALGLADDLASALLLATDRPILAAPAMNTRMWRNPATVRNLRFLQENGLKFVGPEEGPLAEDEWGMGRMAEPEAILDTVKGMLRYRDGALSGLRAIVTSGPTREAIDPLRYITSRSSGKQGHALAAALAYFGAEVTLISGPVSLPDPEDVHVLHVISAQDMLEAVESTKPVDIFIAAAAVSDWRVREPARQKIKKSPLAFPSLELIETPDILTIVATKWSPRPRLVIGFSAETEQLVERAQEKCARKRCDWIIANDVSIEGGAVSGGIMGADETLLSVIVGKTVESWPHMSKRQAAWKLARKIAVAMRPENGMFSCGGENI